MGTSVSSHGSAHRFALFLFQFIVFFSKHINVSHTALCMVCGRMGWCGLNETHCVLLLSARCFFAFVSTFFQFPSIWSEVLKLKTVCETKTKFGHGEILSVMAVFTTRADPFVSLIGGDHAVGINGLALWKMGAIWSGPGRSGSGLQRAETCHLPTHATAWSFYHLALTRSLILACVDVRLSELGRELGFTDKGLNQ